MRVYCCDKPFCICCASKTKKRRRRRRAAKKSMSSSPYKSFEQYQAGAMDVREFLSICAKCPRHREAFQTWPDFRNAVLAQFREDFLSQDILRPILDTLMSEERVQVAVADMMAADADKTPSQAIDWLVMLCQLLSKPSDIPENHSTSALRIEHELDERRHSLSMVQDEVQGKIRALDRQVKESFDLQNKLKAQSRKIKDELEKQKEVEMKQMDVLENELQNIENEEKRLISMLKALDYRKGGIYRAMNDRRRTINSINKSFYELNSFYDAKVLREIELQRLAATSKTQAVLVQSHCNSVSDGLSRMSLSLSHGNNGTSDGPSRMSQSHCNSISDGLSHMSLSQGNGVSDGLSRGSQIHCNGGAPSEHASATSSDSIPILAPAEIQVHNEREVTTSLAVLEELSVEDADTLPVEAVDEEADVSPIEQAGRRLSQEVDAGVPRVRSMMCAAPIINDGEP